jgi:hypothetical protein
MKLIDADKLIDSMDDRYKEKVNNVPDILAEGFMQMEILIKEQPTAFDVDKVVEQLEKYQEPLYYYQDTYTSGQISAYDKAIKIVKAGGMDD